MILYFSGTGNSQWAARRLAEALDDEVVSINCIMKEGTSAPLRSRKPFVFVAPTYAWRLPRVVDRWIRGASFAGSNDAYFVLTCGGSVGNAAAYALVGSLLYIFECSRGLNLILVYGIIVFVCDAVAVCRD